MKEIKQTAIVGMGALGLLFGNRIAEACRNDNVCFVADEERVRKYEEKTITINDLEKNFIIKSAKDAKVVDLVIVATKYNHLDDALDVIRNCVGKDTTIISIINGINSEEIIGEKYGIDKVIYTVAQGMDAVKIGGDFKYTHFGELRIGQTSEVSKERFESLVKFFDRVQMPYTIDEDIIHRMWGKFMLNVGINQVCMVYETTYGGALSGTEESAVMYGAMQEVIDVAKVKGIALTQKDLEGYIALMKTLDPEAAPSMRQDGMLRRPSEVEMFAGKIIELGNKYGLSVSINEMLYQRIKEMEASYT